MPQLERNPCTATKTQHSQKQINIKKKKKEKGLPEGSRCGLGEETEQRDAKKVKALFCSPVDISAQRTEDSCAGWMVLGAWRAPSPGQGA